MKSIILIVEQCTRWTQYGAGSRYLDSREPQGLQQAMAQGAELVEQLESRESRTGHEHHHYTMWRVRFPIKLISDLKGRAFEGLTPTAPIPDVRLPRWYTREERYTDIFPAWFYHPKHGRSIGTNGCPSEWTHWMPISVSDELPEPPL